MNMVDQLAKLMVRRLQFQSVSQIEDIGGTLQESKD